MHARCVFGDCFFTPSVFMVLSCFFFVVFYFVSSLGIFLGRHVCFPVVCSYHVLVVFCVVLCFLFWRLECRLLFKSLLYSVFAVPLVLPILSVP